jgi:hypothetical protein
MTDFVIGEPVVKAQGINLMLVEHEYFLAGSRMRTLVGHVPDKLEMGSYTVEFI